MTGKVIPVVGSLGYYELAAPFDTDVVHHIEYRCKAVRRLSELIANNETPWESLYQPKGIEETIYEEDLAEDAYVVSLQSNQGQWLYVPYRYILSYPSTDGIPYRSLMIGISLPALPVSQDLNGLYLDLKDIVENFLGASVLVKPVETSKRVLVPAEVHATKLEERAQRRSAENSLYAQNVALQRTNQMLTERLAALEQYIATHHV